MIVALIVQSIIYLILLLLNSYLGTMLSLIIGLICFCVWLVSLVVEWIEPSRVPKSYYRLMIAGWLAPLFSLIAFAILRGGMEWLPPEVSQLIQSIL